jgi:hypothetical protein
MVVAMVTNGNIHKYSQLQYLPIWSHRKFAVHISSQRQIRAMLSSGYGWLKMKKQLEYMLFYWIRVTALHALRTQVDTRYIVHADI